MYFDQTSESKYKNNKFDIWQFEFDSMTKKEETGQARNSILGQRLITSSDHPLLVQQHTEDAFHYPQSVYSGL